MFRQVSIMRTLPLIAILLTVTGIFVASNIYTFIPIYSQVAQSLLVSENQAVIAGSLFTLFYAFGLLCFGAMSDIIKIKIIIVWGMFGAAVATLVIGLAENMTILYFARAFQGFTLASFAPMAFAYTFDLFQGRQRTLLLVFINTGYLVAGIFGQLCSSFISSEFGWRFVFYFFSATYFLFFALSLYYLPDNHQSKTKKQSSPSGFSKLFKVKGLLPCYVITFSLLFSSVAFYDTIERSFTSAQVLRMVGLIGAILSLFTGKLIEQFKTSGTLVLGTVIGIVSLLFMIFFKEKLIYLVTILFISSIALLIPTIVSRIGSLTGEHRVKALSMYSFILLIGATFAPPLVIHLSFQQVLLVLIGFYTVNLFLIKHEQD
jgi:predicted MFS family arabinose efflux permease